MRDRLGETLEALERTPVPVTWDDVEARETLPFPDAPQRRRRPWLLAAAAAVLAVVAGAAVVVAVDDENDPTETGPAPTTTEPPTTVPGSPAPTTRRTFAVTAWTGSLYLVWGGETGGDGVVSNDGWMFDPTTGETEPIPPAPIASRSGATGAWTVDELIVCCGIAAAGDRTDTAAAYNVSTGMWRTLADPPAALVGRYAAGVWHQRCPNVEAECDPDRPPIDFVVVSGGVAQPTEVATYDTRSDRWRTIDGAPDGIGTQPEIAWTGTDLILWKRAAHGDGADSGYRYDPATDTWGELPPLPEPVTRASIVWAGNEILVWGLHADDDTRGVGARWRPGDDEWTPLPDPGLPTIDYYNGTPGSQALVWDDVTERVILWPTHGGEHGYDESGAPGPIPILAYDTATDSWERLGQANLGYPPTSPPAAATCSSQTKRSPSSSSSPADPGRIRVSQRRLSGSYRSADIRRC